MRDTVNTAGSKRACALFSVLLLLEATADTRAHGAATVSSTSLAAHFSSHLNRIQLISIPGQWNGFSTTKAVSVETWVKMTDHFGGTTPLFAYSVRQPLQASVVAKELALEFTRHQPASQAPFPAWTFKDQMLLPNSKFGPQSSAPSPAFPGGSSGGGFGAPDDSGVGFPQGGDSFGGFPPAGDSPAASGSGDDARPPFAAGGEAGSGGASGPASSSPGSASAPQWAASDGVDTAPSGSAPAGAAGSWAGGPPAFNVATNGGVLGGAAIPPKIEGPCVGAYRCATWNHVVATFNFTSGEHSIYMNGTLLYSAELPFPAGDLLPGGVFHMGADITAAPGFPSQLRATPISNFAVDVFRVYNRVLSAEEVSAGLWAAEPAPGTRDSLVLDWRFDDSPRGGADELDLSGNANHGRWGESNDAQFPRIFKLAVSKDVSVDTSVYPPRYIISDAPARHAASVSALAVPGVPLKLLLAGNESSADNCTLLSLPRAGTLQPPGPSSAQDFGIGSIMPSCVVQYTPPPASAWPVRTGEDQLLAEFAFRVAGDSARDGLATVYGISPGEPVPRAHRVTLPGNKYTMALGGTCADGTQAVLQLLSRPVEADFYDVDPGSPFPIQRLGLYGQAEQDEFKQTVAEWAASTYASKIQEYPANCTNPGGYVYLVTNENTPSHVINTWVDFSWICPYGDPTAVSRMQITILPVNKPPEVMPAQVTALPGQGRNVLVRMRAADADGTPHLGGEVALFRLLRGPRLGSLHQVASDGSAGAPVSRYGLSNPRVNYVASSVPAYDPRWGPSWSTQASSCDGCCEQQATCTVADCLPVGSWQPVCYSYADSFHIEEGLLGSDETSIYKAGCTHCGRQWFVVGFTELMYITAMTLSEYGVTGAVTSLKGAERYAGNQTLWTDLWHNDAVDPRESAIVNEWSPALCPFYSSPVQWLRVEFDTDALGTPVGFSKVEAFGTLEPPANIVQSADSQLVYQPIEGVYAADPDAVWDEFTVVATDCDVEGDPVVLPIQSPALAVPCDSIFGEWQSETAPVGRDSELRVDLRAAQAHLQSVLSEAVALEEFVVEVQCPQQLNMALSLADGSAVCAGDRTLLTNDTPVRVEPNRDMLSSLQSLVFTATARGVTYRLGMRVAGVCPQDANLFECAAAADACLTGCAQHPQACAGLPEDAVISFDPTTYICVTTADSESSGISLRVVVPLVSLLLIAVLVAALLLALWLQKYARQKMRMSGPPSEGDMVTLVTTDIHGSTTLWDAYPQEFAQDISLHHECLRANLKTCHGYEIATEGDSFKCAFRTAEDAICWSVLVQLELLCAPWTANLEDGGHSMLRDKEDWADCSSPSVLSPFAQDVIARLTSLDGVEAIRSELSSVPDMKPLYNPSLNASIARSPQPWDAAYGGPESRVVYGSESLALPIFRGPRVRIGLHTGMATSVTVNPVTKRRVYGGQVAEVAKAVSDAPCGGMIVMSGETLAAVASMQDLGKRVALLCAGWRPAETADGVDIPAAISVMSLGSHLMKPAPAVPERTWNLSSVHMPGFGGVEPRTSSSTAVPLDDAAFDDPSSSARDDGVPIARGVLARLPPLGVRPSGSFYVTRHPHAGEAAQDGDGASAQSAVIEDEYVKEADRLLRAQHELKHATELVMLVPWPLKARTLFFPPVDSHKSLSVPWSAAPPAQGVTIVFTFLEGASYFASLPEDVAGGAMEQLQAVVRSELHRHKGYEVEVEEANFVAAFRCAHDAAMFGMACQTTLVKVHWDPLLLAQPWAAMQMSPSGEVSFRGPRLAIGMCTGNAMRVQPCLRTGKMEYYGPIMNHAARVAVAAHGGQVLLHETTWNQIIEHDPAVADTHMYTNMGHHNLKGVKRAVYIVQAVPPALGVRTFPPIKTKKGKAAKEKQVQMPGIASVRATHLALDRYLLSVGAIDAAPSTPAKEAPSAWRGSGSRRRALLGAAGTNDMTMSERGARDGGEGPMRQQRRAVGKVMSFLGGAPAARVHPRPSRMNDIESGSFLGRAGPDAGAA